MAQVLEGMAVAVTGAGRGIGRAVALEMARNGARVVVNDVGVGLQGETTGETPADEVVAEIEAAGGTAVADRNSVASEAGGRGIVASAMEAFGRLDCVVNNAGILRDRIFHKMTADDWSAVIDVHLNGSFHVSRAAAEVFRAQGGGSMIHMTSPSGLVGNFGQANYSAAKLGIMALSKSIALDMQRFGVRSNCIAPFAWTRMIDSLPTDTPEQQARVGKLKKLKPEKVAPLAVFLASPLSREVNGQVFLLLAVQVASLGDGPLELIALCGDACQGNVQLDRQAMADGAWREFKIPLRCFQESGAAMNALEGFMMRASGSWDGRLSELKLATGTEDALTCQ